jgi:O-antigen/teichoic acid export membrane protein
MIGAIVGFLFVYLTIDKYGIFTASTYQLLIQSFLFIVMAFYTFRIYTKNLKFKKEYFLLLWHRMKYIFIGSFYYRTNDLVERVIASYLTTGFLSLVAFIQRVYGAIITVLNTSIAGPTITKFSNLIKERKFKEIKKVLYNYLLLLFIIDVSIFLFLFIFGKETFLYFFSDRIDSGLISILFYVIVFLFAIVFGKTLGMLQRSLLMSSKKEKVVTIINSSVFTFNILSKILLTYFYGAVGLLVAILISEILTLLIQQIYIEKVLFNEFNI